MLFSFQAKCVSSFLCYFFKTRNDSMQCYTASDLKNIYGVEGNISREQLIQMCPALVQQIISGSCNQTSNETVTAAPTDPSYTDAMSKFVFL